ncbi:flagellar basal body-associated FliL family protein [uncultured Roseovarius sp.]|uniref:flagellar basal body-associated FliL family protein n=1 Tax=uncultured Roseovarius sp. TaxID=293344 RepID=UPI00260F94BA|nr:flagellar basal body-associated FliL family protein [uncultured Roseovarius sp.]
MAEPDKPENKPAKTSLKKPLLVGLVLAVLGGGGGYFVVGSGILALGADIADSGEDGAEMEHAIPVAEMPDVAFVPISPLVVSVGQGAERLHLRFRAELEVKSAFKSDVEDLQPRIVDVMNTYLRALKLSDLEETSALVRLRAQLLRRIQVVTGGGRINDLLIMEFVLN